MSPTRAHAVTHEAETCADHIVKSFDDQLEASEHRHRRRWAGCARPSSPTRSRRSRAATWRWPSKPSHRTARIDALEQQIEQQAVKLLALRQPMARRPARDAGGDQDSARSRAHRRSGQEHRQARAGVDPRPPIRI